MRPMSAAVNGLRSSTLAHMRHAPRNTGEGSGFRRCGIDDRLDLGDGVGGESALAGVLPHQLLVRGDVHAVDLVTGDEALLPLDLGAELVKDAAGLLRDRLQLLGGELTRSRNLALYDV